MFNLPVFFKTHTKDAWAIAALLALIGLQFRLLPSGYWRADDPAILLHALNSSGFSAFYDPNDWHKLSASNLTPWLTLSFKFDLWLAGLSPQFFYLHSLGSLGLVAVAAYALNRLWLAPIWAFFSVLLFLVGAPTASVTELLMTRHYLEGLLFALMSTIAFVHATRQRSTGWAAAGAVAYALAATAKEIYVPLVLVLPLIPPIGSIRMRLKLIAPYVAVAALYVLWRQYMLGAMVGGYADTESMFSMQSVNGMLTALSHFPDYMFGPHWVIATVVCGTALAVSAYKKPHGILFFAALTAGIVLPLVPLIAFPGISGPDRYLFLFWFVSSFATTFAVQSTVSAIVRSDRARSIAGATLCLVLTGITAQHAATVHRSNEATYREFDVQGRFYYEADQHQGFIPSATLLHGYWYVTNFCDIKKRMGLDCPVALIRGVPTDHAVDRVLTYDAARGTMEQVPGRPSDIVSRSDAVDTARPLSANVSIANGVGRWRLGPYKVGQYYFASAAIGRFPVPMDGVLKTPYAQLALYVQYESPEGCVTTSPLFVVGEGQPLSWERKPGSQGGC